MSDLLGLIGNRVRTLRKLQALSQEELAERAGLHFSYIGGLERGERNASLKSLERVILALGVDFEEFFESKKNNIENEGTILLNLQTVHLLKQELGKIDSSVKKVLKELNT